MMEIIIVKFFDFFIISSSYNIFLFYMYIIYKTMIDFIDY